MLDSLRHALREMERRRLRAAGVLLGYAACAAALVLVLMSIQSTRQAAVDTLWDIGAHTMAFVPCQCEPLDGPKTAARYAVNNMPAMLLPAEVVDTLRRSPAIADASPYLLLYVSADGGKDEWVVGGFDPSRPKAFSATMAAASQTVAGEFLRPGKSEGVMVEKEFAAAQGLSVGSELRLGTTALRVAAIVAPPLRPGKANIYMDIAALRPLASVLTGMDPGGAVNAVLVESQGALFHKEALAGVRQALGQGCQISSFGCSAPGTLAMGVHERAAALLALCAVIGLFVLLLRNQAAQVVERRREIAVLRAIGWGSGDIAKQMLAAALLQAVAGGLAGCVGGLAASRSVAVQGWVGMQGSASLPAAIATAACVFGLALLAGVAAGLVPALSAARLRPAGVLRQP